MVVLTFQMALAIGAWVAGRTRRLYLREVLWLVFGITLLAHGYDTHRGTSIALGFTLILSSALHLDRLER